MDKELISWKIPVRKLDNNVVHWHWFLVGQVADSKQPCIVVLVEGRYWNTGEDRIAAWPIAIVLSSWLV